ncbi:hypothetical protein QQG55_44655 [Brugia pahangi]
MVWFNTYCSNGLIDLKDPANYQNLQTKNITKIWSYQLNIVSIALDYDIKCWHKIRNKISKRLEDHREFCSLR